MMKHNKDNVCIDDYVELSWCTGWHRVTETSDDSFDALDDFGSSTNAQYRDIRDLKLESEMS